MVTIETLETNENDEPLTPSSGDVQEQLSSEENFASLESNAYLNTNNSHDNRLSVLSEASSARNDSDYHASGESDFGSARDSMGSSEFEHIHRNNLPLLGSSIARNRKYSDEEVCSWFLVFFIF